MKKEIWKSIPIYPWEGFYEASSLGNIRCAPRILPQHTADGYKRVCLHVGHTKMTVSSHRLVTAAFHGKPKIKDVANHKNCNRSDNRPTNLEWTTYSGNTIHAHENLLNIPHGMRKMIPELIFIKLKEGQSTADIAKDFGVAYQTIRRVIKEYRMDKKSTTKENVIKKKISLMPSLKIDIQVAKKMRKNGDTYAKIAKHFKCSEKNISIAFRRIGFYTDPIHRPILPRKEIIKLRKSGWYMERIALKYNATNRTIKRVLSSAGIK